MNRKCILGFLIIFFVSFSGRAGEIIKTYEFKAPNVILTEDYAVISFDGSVSRGEPGKATLPFYPVKVLLPPGEIAACISVEFEKPLYLKGAYKLLPRQFPTKVSDTSKSKSIIDNEFYRLDEFYPDNIEYNVETHFFRGFGIALAAFTPIRYHPARQEVMFYQRVIVRITTIPDPDHSIHEQNHVPDESTLQLLSGLIQNPDMVREYFSGRDLRTSDYDYLILTAAQYVGEFDTLASFYKPRGIRSKITSLEFISANTSGNDLQEKIRNYIIAEYDSCGIDYVLLGGDAEIVPYRGFYCLVVSDDTIIENNIPADIYYAALDGNWNTDGDNLWAEPDEDDLYPEVAIGRMTFSDTSQLHNMLHKTMLYQSDPVEGELTKPLLAGEYLYGSPVTYGSDYLNLLIGYHSDNGYTTTGIPDNHPRDTLYDRYSSWTKAILMNHINSGRPWVHHVGHANYSYTMKMYNSDITNANFSQANGIDHNFSIVYTHGCNCGGFDASDCIAEKMIEIDNFAVAFIGNSRYGWFNQGTTDGPSQHLHREFMDAVYSDSLYHLGMAHLKSKSETAPFVEISGEFEPGATRWCFYDNNVLGDPMLAVWTEEPGLITANFPPLIPIGADNVIVQISGPLSVYPDFACSIYRNDTLFGTAKTGPSGTAIIQAEASLTEGTVSLVVSGYNILDHYFDIQVSDYWLGWSQDWNDPANWFKGAVPDSSTHVIIPANPAGTLFPLKNNGEIRQCKSILIEAGAALHLGSGESFSIGGN